MKSKSTNEQALALRQQRADLWREPEWQRLWLGLQGRPWLSLAVVPAATGGPPDFTMRVAVTLARTGMVHLGRPVHVADASKVPLAYLTTFMEEVHRCVREGEVILVALGPIFDSPVTISIAQATDAALLCVLLEHMATAQANRTVAQVGRNRFVGSVIFRDGDLNQ
jgi:hypothetical protein